MSYIYVRPREEGAHKQIKLIFRRAVAADAMDFYEIAEALSKKNKILQGATEKDLSDSGFLLYPLAVSDPNVANYEERITVGDYCGVAIDEENSRTVAFMMGYTFQQYKKMNRLTDNDIGVIEFFTGLSRPEKERKPDNTIYIGQVAVHPDYARRKIGTLLIIDMLKESGDAPQAIAEIAQEPQRNNASSTSFERAGFEMKSKRIKQDPTTKTDRTSGTFEFNF